MRRVWCPRCGVYRVAFCAADCSMGGCAGEGFKAVDQEDSFEQAEVVLHRRRIEPDAVGGVRDVDDLPSVARQPLQHLGRPAPPRAAGPTPLETAATSSPRGLGRSTTDWRWAERYGEWSPSAHIALGADHRLVQT